MEKSFAVYDVRKDKAKKPLDQDTINVAASIVYGMISHNKQVDEGELTFYITNNSVNKRPQILPILSHPSQNPKRLWQPDLVLDAVSLAEKTIAASRLYKENEELILSSVGIASNAKLPSLISVSTLMLASAVGGGVAPVDMLLVIEYHDIVVTLTKIGMLSSLMSEADSLGPNYKPLESDVFQAPNRKITKYDLN